MWPTLLSAPWGVFLGWWWIRSLGAARTVERESLSSILSYRVALHLGTALLVLPWHRGPRLWPGSIALLVTALVLECAGIAFAIWARETLGKLWSGTITLKEGHHVVRAGPYRLARHPIYTGLGLALAAVALARGDLPALAGFVLFALALARKIQLEERLLERQFGDEYREYRRQVRAVIPFIL